MSAFKVGDRVRYLGGSGWEFLQGKRGQVFTVHRCYQSESSNNEFIQIEEGLKANPAHSQYPKLFALVKSAEPERVEIGGYVRKIESALTAAWSERWNGVFEVLGYEQFGYKVFSLDGLNGTFRFDLAERAEAPAKPDFTIAEAKRGAKLKFRSGCDVVFIAYVPSAKPHCRLVLLNPGTGNIVTRYENGRADDEPQAHANPGDILINRG